MITIEEAKGVPARGLPNSSKRKTRIINFKERIAPEKRLLGRVRAWGYIPQATTLENLVENVYVCYMNELDKLGRKRLYARDNADIMKDIVMYIDHEGGLATFDFTLDDDETENENI